ncbi:MAG: ABC transporter substrate-binding protein [Gammaproteobacteria bacterium]|nr:ABC transporter substrate-binding protein [Gammaproteobacteria bacterium]
MLSKLSGCLVIAGFAVGLVSVTTDSHSTWNNPYTSSDANKNILYSSFEERPKHLDPVRSYSSDEYSFIAQIYEPPLQYHFLKRPYTLIPLTVVDMPTVNYFTDSGEEIDGRETARIAYSEYQFRINPAIRYQPHPALARGADGGYLYHALSADKIAALHGLADLTEQGTRELIAEDYVYQIKRMADPHLHSPLTGVMGEYIVGFAELGSALVSARKALGPGQYLDLREYPLSGVQVVDRYTYRIRVRGKYPQFLYWQAMPFFAPMPWEADLFYSQPGLEEKNITLDWYPVGTGPFMLTENNPNLRMVMERNPYFHGETYPTGGEDDDRENGLLADAGRPLPFIDRAVYSLEKETIPRWNKFLQGYYDNSGISSDSFDQAVQFNVQGEAALTDEMRERGMNLATSVSASIYYMGFNMRNPVLGGDSEPARKLRRAISIAVDFEEFISIFTNGRGIPAQGPLPPEIFGYRSGREGINPYVYDWADGKPRRKPVSEAARLLVEAGYPNGVDAQTGNPLVIHFEAVARGPDDKARLNWIRKQFSKIGLQLVIRPTDYNRFREKMLNGSAEVFMWGWNADYPDPENFFFLLYGPNSKVEAQGENASNYQNPEFDRLFERMKNMDNSPQRQEIIDQMMTIIRRDAPWIWGFHPKSFALFHSWYHNVKPNLMANNTLKYTRLEPQLREKRRTEWNQPVLWPLGLVGGVIVISIIPAVVSFRNREKRTAL